MKAAFLPDRGVVKVSGEDAGKFLNGLVTTDITLLQPGVARFGALLTPQGKITFDFLITEAPDGHGGGLLIDCRVRCREGLRTGWLLPAARQGRGREHLRQHGRAGGMGRRARLEARLAFADPRLEALGWRILAPEDFKQKVADLIGADLVESDAYEAHRIASGIPRGGLDFMYSDAFPHETNMDRLHGVDFDKGCYVGQEVVSRMQHRGTARTRIVRLVLDDFSPETGTPVLAGDKPVGTMGSTAAARVSRCSGSIASRTRLLPGCR